LVARPPILEEDAVAPRLNGAKIAIFVDEGFEDLEFYVTLMRLQEERADVTVLGSSAGKEVTGKNGLQATVERAASDFSADDFEAVVVPGGWAPDKLRRDESITSLVRKTYDLNKTVGLICHAGLVGISAGIVEGHDSTGSLGIKDDLINAGARWRDEPAFRTDNIVWGRVVQDIPDFCRELVNAIEEQLA
jgi:protease I